MLRSTRRSALRALAFAALLLSVAAHAASTDVPAPGQSPKIDAIKQRGSLRVAAIGEFPWLTGTTSSGTPRRWAYSSARTQAGPENCGPLEVVPVSHETKVPILATGDADISIAPLAVTPQRLEVVNFVVYSRSSLCFFGLADNPKLKDVKSVDDLNRDDLTMAYFTGTPPEAWAPGRFPEVEFRAVSGSGANAPVEEVMSKRADFASIDNVAWPQLAKQVPGLVVFPSGDDCLQSNEMATGVGLAVDKGDPVFRDWLEAVYEEVKDKVTAAELELLKGS